MHVGVIRRLLGSPARPGIPTTYDREENDCCKNKDYSGDDPVWPPPRRCCQHWRSRRFRRCRTRHFWSHCPPSLRRNQYCSKLRSRSRTISSPLGGRTVLLCKTVAIFRRLPKLAKWLNCKMSLGRIGIRNTRMPMLFCTPSISCQPVSTCLELESSRGVAPK